MTKAEAQAILSDKHFGGSLAELKLRAQLCAPGSLVRVHGRVRMHERGWPVVDVAVEAIGPAEPPQLRCGSPPSSPRPAPF